MRKVEEIFTFLNRCRTLEQLRADFRHKEYISLFCQLAKVHYLEAATKWKSRRGINRYPLSSISPALEIVAGRRTDLFLTIPGIVSKPEGFVQVESYWRCTFMRPEYRRYSAPAQNYISLDTAEESGLN